ncbi:sensor histidine kinase [Paucibacter sp. XJ19-41]|uniref:sensor histidine kinase n=1 Tax=Paucibacter sp. XJ19-41 TaxID=2927824 RepID=UPI00234B0E0D|nr:HAMP domain-containing sensor histidine kinase [Paucibacter sp. XJ19-41]MDC6166750.1 HAMP domain-containing sensor histidine kinase [Paucibacter sp. XJ19-41]
MRGWWRRLVEPSVLRGLLLAQIALVSLVWLGLVLLVVRESQQETALRQSVPAMEALVATAEALVDQPEALHRVLGKVDEWNRLGGGEQDDPMLRTGMLVWRGAARVFATDGLPASLYQRHPEGLKEIEMVDGRWQVLTVHSGSGSDVAVSFIYPQGIMAVMVALNSRGYLLLPLIVSLPLLVLPAWLSVRWALRPWRRLSAEVARRDEQELSPITLPARERELRPLLEAINRLLGRLRGARTRERQFVADAAHELRTPLSAMSLYAESMQRLALPPPAAPLLDGMLRSSARATRLINQLLTLTRSEAEAQAPARRLDLAVLVGEVLAETAILAEGRRVQLDCELPESLWLDGQAEGLGSLFGNLIENAIKYSPEGGRVSLRLWREGGEICARLSDQGPGIAPAWREAVLHRFARLPDQSQAGSGLGLAIVASVLQSHGGRLTLDDAPGGGLLVRLWLPAADSARA